MIAVCPDTPLEIVSCHLSASYRVMKRSETLNSYTRSNVNAERVTHRVGTPSEARVQGFDFGGTKCGDHGPPLSFMCVSWTQNQRFYYT